MVKAISRTFPLDLMMKSVHFQVKKRLSFEVQKVVVVISVHPPLSAASARLARRRIWQSISIKAARYARNQCAKHSRCLQPGSAQDWR